MQLHAECEGSAHPCFPCKLALWRSEGRSPFAPMPDGWRGPSVRERARRQVEEARSAGWDPEPVGYTHF